MSLDVLEAFFTGNTNSLVKTLFDCLHSDQRLPDRGRTEREQRQIKQEVSRSLKWAEMIKEERKYFGAGAKHREKMINRVYKGVPDSVRGKLWYILLDIERIKKEQQGTYVVSSEMGQQEFESSW